MNRFDEREMRFHMSVLGWLFIVEGALVLVIALLAFFLLPTIGAVAGDTEATTILGIVGTAVGLFMAALAVPGLLAGYGLLKRKSWARFLALVIGVLGLVNFPVGTAIGVYTLLVLLQESANEYFEQQQTG